MDDKWFRRQQKLAGITAEDIAKRVNKDRSIVSRIYNGHQRMSLDWAKAFAEALQVPLEVVLEKAGITDPETAQKFSPSFAESDAAEWVPQGGTEAEKQKAVAHALGGGKPGVDVWRVKSPAMALAGFLVGDFLLVDSHAAERVRPGDVVVAQIYDNVRGVASTVLRRFEPPVLVAASCDPEDARVKVVDGVNVVIRGKVAACWRS